ncbi:MAG TPA: ABC transporter substrate-binding protein [Candidatus Dormibacteraeota bacterium]|nr:ABC transporter substrate-binding protein [Candidatus Dormibacteraeota bacterium]
MKRTVAVAALLVALAGCAKHAQAPDVYAAEQHKRIVSLAPSLTEDLFALGAGGQVVGTSAYSSFPPEARKLPVIDAAGWIDAEKILALRPDFVIGLPSDAARTTSLQRAKVPVFLMRDDSYDDIFRNLDELGVLTGRLDAAQGVETRVRSRVEDLKKKAAALRVHPRIFFVLDVDPIYTAGRGSYLDTLLTMAGGRNVVASSVAYPNFSAERLLAEQPDALIVASAVNLTPLLSRAPWSDLRAVREGRVYRVPPNSALEIPGPRVADGLAWLVGVVERLQR